VAPGSVIGHYYCMNATTQRNAIGYARVSTGEQAQEGVSLAEQRRCIERYCAERGLTLLDVIEDAGESGASWDRAGLRQVFARLGVGDARPPSALSPRVRKPRRRKDDASPERMALVVTKLDRLSRDAFDMMGLLSCGFLERHDLHSVRDFVDTHTASGRFALRMHIIQAQYEREVTAERTSRALQHIQSTGRHIGAVPFGWRKDAAGALVADAAQQDVIGLAETMRGLGRTLAEIAVELTSAGYPSPRGLAWSSMQVSRVLERAQTAPGSRSLEGQQAPG
jgi:site-specific DNA recombinase